MLKKLVALLFFLPGMLIASPFVVGTDYQILSNLPAAKSNYKWPLIQEFFSYGCPWCYKIEAPLFEWLSKLDKRIQFEQFPVVFKPSWELYAKAYYTAKTLALTDKMNFLLFKTIQEDGKALDSKQEMINFFVAQGVDKQIATSAFLSSPTIDLYVRHATALMANYQIEGVPCFVVNSKYKTDLHMAGSPERLLQILDYLTTKSV